MRYLFSFILILSSIVSFSQQKFFIGTKAYDCTPTFTLVAKDSFTGHDLEVCIIKNSNTGMIALSTKLMSEGVRIKGNILIYLEDNTVITCIDRGKFDVVDNIATTIYYLTEGEINKMKESNIYSIRFNLKCYNCMISSEEGTFSVSNTSSIFYTEKEPPADVPSLLMQLFD